MYSHHSYAIELLIEQELKKLADHACHVVPTEELRPGCTYYIGHSEHISSDHITRSLGEMATKVDMTCVMIGEGLSILE